MSDILSQIVTSSVVTLALSSASRPAAGAAGPPGPAGPVGATGSAGNVPTKSVYSIWRNSDTDYVLPACISGADLRDAGLLSGIVVPQNCSVVALSARFKLEGYTAAGDRNWGFTRTRGAVTEVVSLGGGSWAQPGWINYSATVVVEEGDLLRFTGVLATSVAADSELKVVLLG